MKKSKIPFALKSAPLVLTMATLLSACGGSSSSSGDANAVPKADNMSLTLQSGETVTRTLVATDANGDALTYTISKQPTHGTATINGDKITYVANNEIAQDAIEITVTDGKASAKMNIAITLQSEAAFGYQFYSVTNPETANKQIVRYDPNDDNAETNQTVIKTNVILGSNVFVISGVKDGDKTVYQKREYGIFLDPNASSEKRTKKDPRTGADTEYTFFTDNVLKKFAAQDTASESTIFSSSMIPQNLKTAGITVVGEEQQMHLNYVDIDNSYVQLMGYDKLADVDKSEKPDENLHVPMAVRLSDSSVTQGRIISSVVNSNSGKTEKVLVNFIAPHKKGAYPTGDANAQRLQICGADLSSCSDITGGAGNYFKLGQNDAHIYLAKDSSADIYAYSKADDSVTKVTGVTYPATYDHHHHQISTSGHGGAGILSTFTTIGNIKQTVSDGNTSYIAINYDLDADTPIGSFYGSNFHMFKHAMILKITGTAGQKVFDNGDGVDDMNMSTDNGQDQLKDHISLVAAKDGKVFMEMATYAGNASLGGTCTPSSMGANCSIHRQGWLDTTSGTFPKTDLDKDYSEQPPTMLNYLLANRVPALAVGNDVYFSIWDKNSSSSSYSGQKRYNVYKMPFGDLTQDLPENPTANGRMFYERTAYRSNGIYEGSVVVWDAISSNVTNVTTGQILGSDSTIEETENEIVNVLPKSSHDNQIGVGGLFGLYMSTSHGGTPYISSGKTASANSIKKVNHKKANWIID